jgi:hypothetical protein
VEQAPAGFGTMIGFDKIPNKNPVNQKQTETDVWPDMGSEFVINQFYKQYSCAEGWLGDGYLAIWTQEEVQSYHEPNLEAYPAKYSFFASDGGGTQFGFCSENGKPVFVSAPDIGNEDDIRVLGDWESFLASVETGDYI